LFIYLRLLQVHFVSDILHRHHFRQFFNNFIPLQIVVEALVEVDGECRWLFQEVLVEKLTRGILDVFYFSLKLN
jgi:hypothetical protein